MKQLLGPESDIFSFKRMEPLGQTLVLAMDSFKLTLEADYEPLVVVTVLFFAHLYRLHLHVFNCSKSTVFYLHFPCKICLYVHPGVLVEACSGDPTVVKCKSRPSAELHVQIPNSTTTQGHSTCKVKDWGGAMLVELDMSLEANYYSYTLGTFEPLLEQVEVSDGTYRYFLRVFIFNSFNADLLLNQF